jgi:homoserine/homoserine lactone efflux protein
MAPATIFLFALTELALSLTPGPAVLLVVSQGMISGFRGSLRSTLGVLTGEFIFFSLSAIGLGTLLVASQSLFMLIRWLGAAYIVYLGLKLIQSSFKQNNTELENSQAASQVRLYRQGLLMQLANPKAILFFTALLPQFIIPELPVAFQFMVLGVVSMMVQGSTLLLYGWLAGKGGHWFKQSRFAGWLYRLAGAFLIGAGVKLAMK